MSGPVVDGSDATGLDWTDNHCHLPTENPGEVIAAARDAGVRRLVHVGTDVASSRVGMTMAAEFTDVWATAGVHPHDASAGIEGLDELIENPWCVAVGECGLDFHYDHSPRDVQAAVFAAQIALAHDRDLALVVHTREAWSETFDILDREGVPERTVFHCFTGGPDEAEAALARGGHLSFSGIVTFPSAADVRAAAAMCPLDRMLVETDSPYLAPVPHRGKRNQPAWVGDVGIGLAAASGHHLAEIAVATWANAEHVYRLAADRS